jgi:fermentation-respiration switch protein FrsA (DUF1100 family)
MAAALGALLLAYLALASALERVILFPHPAPPAVSPAEGRSDVQVAWVGQVDKTEVWMLPPHAAAGPAPYLIFTHGNAELIDDWIDAFEVPRSWGVGVLLVEYPGYGRSLGKPSEAAVRETLLDAYDFLERQPGVDPSRIVAYGRSIGGGAACTLLPHRELAGLILESTFTSLRPLMRPFGLVGPLVRDPFDSVTAVERFDGPTLVLHGEKDTLIPVSHGRELAARARAAELHLLDCGHNDCPQSWDRVYAFLLRNRLIDVE